MHLALGFLIAAFAALLIIPAYRRRTIRLTTDAIKRSMPLTEAEIRAEKDKLRADYVLSIHNLESKLEKATLAHARQRVEINRRDAAISALEGELDDMRGSLEEHENAHRVLEQTIMDRLPRVESRLAEARRLILQRDREIAELSQTGQKQARALEEANQINAKGRDEVLRLNAALSTRTARGRDAYSDDRQDSEIALRTEIETLRAKTREQSSMIVRLQGLLGRTGARVGLGSERRPPGLNLDTGATEGLAVGDRDEEIARLRAELTEAEAALSSVQTSVDAKDETAQKLDSKLVQLREENEEKAGRLRQLEAELSAYKDAERTDKGLREGKTAMRAKIASLESQSTEQSETIQRLRAEIAAANERTARQAAHFTDELRRLGAGSYQTSASSRGQRTEYAPRQTLTDRISEVGGSGASGDVGSQGADMGAGSVVAEEAPKRSGFLRALGVHREPASAGASQVEEAPDGNGSVRASAGGSPAVDGDAAETEVAADASVQKRAPRRGGLLERITRADGSE